ncbi:MAG: cold shock domain-containing protein [Spirochaetia bacterium]|nr:cold shock domain-containing protein [Spirochaetia bacterium]
MREKKETADNIIQQINKALDIYSNNFSEQFHLKIPKDVIKRVHFYRDEYFHYLKDSVYKSNICYLLQLIDYQIWLYKVFRPVFSLENAYFYQLLVSMGIAAEALAASIIADPLIISDKKDRSLGEVLPEYTNALDQIHRNSFRKNIEILGSLDIIDTELEKKYQNFRLNIRNIVHIQNWNGRLYNSLNLEEFQKKLNEFKYFLLEIKEKVNMKHDKEKLLSKIFPHISSRGEFHKGLVIDFNNKKGFGFIKSLAAKEELFFHVSSILTSRDKITKGSEVKFQYIQGEKGTEAANIKIIN